MYLLGWYIYSAYFILFSSLSVTKVDDSRVKIQLIEGQDGSDYINASYIDVSSGSTVYHFFDTGASWHSHRWIDSNE